VVLGLISFDNTTVGIVLSRWVLSKDFVPLRS
jgi:hypothetical protein